jgi:hypothetical protein
MSRVGFSTGSKKGNKLFANTKLCAQSVQTGQQIWYELAAPSLYEYNRMPNDGLEMNVLLLAACWTGLLQKWTYLYLKACCRFFCLLIPRLGEKWNSRFHVDQYKERYFTFICSILLDIILKTMPLTDNMMTVQWTEEIIYRICCLHLLLSVIILSFCRSCDLLRFHAISSIFFLMCIIPIFVCYNLFRISVPFHFSYTKFPVRPVIVCASGEWPDF